MKGFYGTGTYLSLAYLMFACLTPSHAGVCQTASPKTGGTSRLPKPPVTSAPVTPPPSAIPGSSEAATTANAIAADSRLDRIMDVNEIGIGLEELLRKHSDSDLTLEAGSSCRNQKLQIRLRKRPLRVLMQALSDLLPCQWEPLLNHSGYRLTMRPSAVLKRDTWWSLAIGKHDRAQAEYNAVTLRAMREPSLHCKTDDHSPSESDPALEAMAAAQHDFFAALPAKLQERIVNNPSLSRYSFKGWMDYFFPEEEAVLVRASDLPPAALNALQQSGGASRFLAAFHPSPSDLVIRFRRQGGGIIASLVLPAGESTDALSMVTIPTFLNSIQELWKFQYARSMAFFDYSALDDQLKQLGKSAPEGGKRLAAYARSTVWKNDPSPRKTSGSVPGRNRADVLDWIGETANLEYVADYYSGSGARMTEEERKAKPEMPIKAELDWQARALDTSWKQRDDSIYLFRNNRWYRDDALEVPPDLSARWLAQEKRERKTRPGFRAPMTRDDIQAQLEWEMEAQSKLTLWQVYDGLPALTLPAFRPTPPVKDPITGRISFYIREPQNPLRLAASRLITEWHTVEFYTALGAEQRAALLDGRLPFAALTPPQQNKALSLLLARGAAVSLDAPELMIGLTSNSGKQPKTTVDVPSLRLVVVSPNPAPQSPLPTQ